MQSSTIKVNRKLVNQQGIASKQDLIAVEEPLQVDLIHLGKDITFTITMRTPGQDKYLTYGILFNENVILNASDILALNTLEVNEVVKANVVQVGLTAACEKNLKSVLKINHRRLVSHSGCGICGKTSLTALTLKVSRENKNLMVDISLEQIKKVRQLLSIQPLFSQTGGSHVAGIIYQRQQKGTFSLDFDNAKFFEDVGRHNALDKLIGYELLQHNLDKTGVIVLSGRIGFELVQKVVMTGFSTIIALGAPTSLAVETANQFGLTLIGFAKDNRFNIYTI
ncbi:MAG: formate dehydrogenase accessory sulfurtransferase FdhD [Enterobacterales bacterium]|nr:formate dehydrogenase accessory sulfurtransferase FdhD [Enterobacterales bacterium]